MSALLIFLFGVNILTRQLETRWQLIIGTVLLVLGVLYGALHGFPAVG